MLFLIRFYDWVFSFQLFKPFVRCTIPPGISDLTNCARNWCILSSIMQSRYRNGEYICPGRGNMEVISTVSSIVVNKIMKEWYHKNIAKGTTVEFIQQINCFKVTSKFNIKISTFFKNLCFKTLKKLHLQYSASNLYQTPNLKNAQ